MSEWIEILLWIYTVGFVVAFVFAGAKGDPPLTRCIAAALWPALLVAVVLVLMVSWMMLRVVSQREKEMQDVSDINQVQTRRPTKADTS